MLGELVDSIVEGPHEYDTSWDDILMPSIRRKGRFRVNSLYVFGSFARGAPECGDLDLIVGINVPKGEFAPPEHRVKLMLFGRRRLVDVLVEYNGSRDYRDQFPEARLVWSDESPDWRANISRIEVESSTGREPRKADRIPLSLHRLVIHRGEAEDIVDELTSGRLVDRWVDLADVQPKIDELPEQSQRELRYLSVEAGKKTAELLPHVVEFIHDQTTHDAHWSGKPTPTDVRLNGFCASIGRHRVRLRWFLDADVWALALAPHKVSEGPNGFWVLERGPKHPVVEAFAEVGFWVIGFGSAPGLVDASDGRKTRVVLEAFSSAQRARGFLDEIGGATDEDEVFYLSGLEALRWISRAHSLSLDHVEHETNAPALELAETIRKFQI